MLNILSEGYPSEGYPSGVYILYMFQICIFIIFFIWKLSKNKNCKLEVVTNKMNTKLKPF